MKKLNERQQAFVIAMLEFGGLDNTKAARAAGYSDKSPQSIRVHAHRLAHDPDIQAAIKEEGQKRLNGAAIMAVNTLLQIAQDAPEMKDRLKATEMILNRVGLHAMTEHKVAVTHQDLNSDEMVKRIEAMAVSMGLDSKKLLGSAGYIDAEFEEMEVPEDLKDIF